MVPRILRAVFALIVVAGLPASAHAASVTFDSPAGTISVGDTIVVRAYLDSDSDILNAFDGDITFKNSTANFTIHEVSRAGSALTVWPSPAQVSADGKNITFTAGTGGGISPVHALLFTVVLKITSVGTIAVEAQSAVAYKNDGKGTPVSIVHTPLVLQVGAKKSDTPARDQWSEIVGVDTTPPTAFAITLGNDPSVFDGKKFITFQSSDEQSGIDRYEVAEGSNAPVPSDITYVLVEQSKPVTLTVYAYDKAGNVQTAQFQTGADGNTFLPWLVGGALLLGLIIWLYRRKSHV